MECQQVMIMTNQLHSLLLSALSLIAQDNKVSRLLFVQLHQMMIEELQSLCNSSKYSTNDSQYSLLQQWIQELQTCIAQVIQQQEEKLLLDLKQKKESERDNTQVPPQCLVRMDSFLYKLFKGRASVLHALKNHSVETLATSEYRQWMSTKVPVDSDMYESLCQKLDEYHRAVLEENAPKQNEVRKTVKSSAPTLPRHRFTRTKNDIKRMPRLSFSGKALCASTMKKIELHLGKRAFVIENVLTTEECQELIDLSCKIGYNSIEKEFAKDARDNQRALIISHELADVLWARICPFVEHDEDILKMAPFGFNSHGKWRPCGLNPCFRFCAYFAPCIGFIPHRDANFVQDENNRSVFTCMLYLNEEFEDGTTNFLKSAGGKSDETVKEELERSGGCSVEYTLKPKTGMVVIFDHLLLHEGSPVPSGNKFITRTDLVFNRYENPYPERDDWLRDPSYIKMVNYYKDAAEAECHGNVQLSSELYEKALSIRQNHVDTWQPPT